MSAPSQTPTGTVEKADAMSDLKLHLREVIAEPTDLVKKGTAPPPFFFSFEPSGKDEEKAQKFAAVLGASALARIFAGMALVRSGSDHSADKGGDEGDGRPAHHLSLSNPDEYVAAFNEKAETTLQAFTKGPLANMYHQPDGGSTTSLHQETTSAKLHATVLASIFDGLGQVDKEDMAKLGKVLTGFMLALKPFKVPTTADDISQSDLKHVVAVNYVKSIDITGDGGIYIHKPYTRIVIFSVKPQHWASVLQTLGPSRGKERSADAASDAPQADAPASAAPDTAKVEVKWSLPGFGGKNKPKPPQKDVKINFALNTTVLELELDDAKYNANRGKFEEIFKEMAEDDAVLSSIAKGGGLQGLGRKTCKLLQAVKE